MISLRGFICGSDLIVDDVDDAGAGPDVVTPLPLKSLRKVEKAGDERSIRVRSVRRVFSAISSSFFTLKSSASDDFAAISPSSCPIYSTTKLANGYSKTTKCLPFRRERNALAETLFLSWRRSLLLNFFPSSLASNLSSSSISSSSFLIRAL